jgi:Ferritin-like domain
VHNRFRQLLQESDLHSGAMRCARAGVHDYVEAARDSVAATVGVAVGDDVAALQTAAGLANLAVQTYQMALTLPFIGGPLAKPEVKMFAERTMAQHSEHARAFNAAVQRLGGKPQTGPDPKYAEVVKQAVPNIKAPVDAVGLAITLEDVAAQTYVKDVGLVSTAELRQLFASVAGVGSQHKAILLLVQALLKVNEPQLIARPPEIAQLPAAAGSVGFPDAFYPTAMAAPVEEGAVR